MVRRIAALAFIFFCTSAAWMILGTTIFSRTYSLTSGDLKSRVAASWGTEQEQSPPTASYQREVTSSVETDKGTKQIKKSEMVPVPVEASKIDVAFDLAHRQKGLLWYSTYAVVFGGDYSFTNLTEQDQYFTFRLGFPSARAVYDDLTMSVDGQPLLIENVGNSAVGSIRVPAHKTAVFHVGYRSQGLDTWRYHFGNGISQIRNFTLNMHTNFRDIDFPENTLSPTTKQESAEGWDLT